MGRKIPGKKHKGVKDPFEQLARKNESLRHVVNAPPKDPDFQEVPKRVLEIQRLKEIAKKLSARPKKKKKRRSALLDTARASGYGPRLPGMNKTENHFPKIKQMVGESDEKFLARVDDLTEEIINEASFEKQFNVRVERDKSGNVEKVDLDEDYFIDKKAEEESKAPKKNTKIIPKKQNELKKQPQANSKESPESQKGPSLKKKSLNKKQRLKLKKAALQDKGRDFSDFRDHVKFGEVAPEPPAFTKRPRGCLQSKSPGQQNLLLSKSLKETRDLEVFRAQAISAYRALKKSRLHQGKMFKT